MGRELRRKEERKNKVIKKNEELNADIKGSTIAKLAIFTILILLVLYYVIAVFITKEINISWTNNNTTETNNAEVSNKILAKNIFNQKEDTYYVYFYDFSNSDKNISSAINNSDLTVYNVDTGSALNKNYVTEENGNRKVTSISDLKVKSPTVIKISADKVVAYYEGSSEILKIID